MTTLNVFRRVRAVSGRRDLIKKLLDWSSLRSLVFILCQILLAGFATLWGTASLAQNTTIYLEPNFVYHDPDIGTPYRTSLSAAFADVQAIENYCTYPNGGSVCQNVQNLHPATTGGSAYQFDGVWFLNFFDLNSCQTPAGQSQTCNVSSDWGALQTVPGCTGSGGSASYYGNLSSQNELYACKVVVPPPPPPCPGTSSSRSCIGNPIYAATGQKMQVETDYSGPTNLNFTRTYQSNNGYFSSTITQSFIDGSLPAGTINKACYPSYY